MGNNCCVSNRDKGFEFMSKNDTLVNEYLKTVYIPRINRSSHSSPQDFKQRKTQPLSDSKQHNENLI